MQYVITHDNNISLARSIYYSDVQWISTVTHGVAACSSEFIVEHHGEARYILTIRENLLAGWRNKRSYRNIVGED